MLLSYLVSVGLAWLRPKPYQIKCSEDAIRRGWSRPIVSLTRATQHFTLFSLLLVVCALASGHRETAVVATSLELLVFFLYHGIASYDPTLLGYDNPDLIRECMGWRPPFSRYIVVWLGLHIQHTLAPFILWGYAEHRPEDESLVFGALFFYIMWNHFCWSVQGRPAYPIQEKLWHRGRPVYWGSVFACFLLSSLAASFLDTLY